MEKLKIMIYEETISPITNQDEPEGDKEEEDKEEEEEEEEKEE